MAGRVSKFVDDWFARFASTPQDLAAFRIFYSAAALLYFFQRAYWTLDMPAAFYDPPPGIGSLFDTPPEPWMVYAANWALMLVLALLLAGVYTPAASIASTALMMLNNSFVYSWTKIDHDILLVITPAILAFSGWGSAWSVDAKRSESFHRPWCLAILAFTITIGMFTAGWPKLATGWLDLDSQAVRHTTFVYQQSFGREALLTDSFLRYAPTWFWETEDWLTVVMELGLFVFIGSVRTFRWAIAVLLLFHLGILLTFDIPYIGNVLIYGAFFPMARTLKTVWLWLPACAIAALAMCPYHNWQETVAQVVVVAGFVLADWWAVSRFMPGGRAV